VGGAEGWVAQTMYTHVSKCKNDKNKRRKKKMKQHRKQVNKK
jgi:hypothetical protein